MDPSELHSAVRSVVRERRVVDVDHLGDAERRAVKGLRRRLARANGDIRAVRLSGGPLIWLAEPAMAPAR